MASPALTKIQTIARRKVEAREATISELAREHGTSRSQMRRIIYGETLNPGIDTIQWLAERFGLSLDARPKSRKS